MGRKVVALVVINHPLQYGGKKLGHPVYTYIYTPKVSRYTYLDTLQHWPRYNELGQIVSFIERGWQTENNSTITNVQLFMVMEKFNFFKNFNYLLMEGYDEKLKNFDKSKKKSVIFTN